VFQHVVERDIHAARVKISPEPLFFLVRQVGPFRGFSFEIRGIRVKCVHIVLGWESGRLERYHRHVSPIIWGKFLDVIGGSYEN
jgi:hypothetical protein